MATDIPDYTVDADDTIHFTFNGRELAAKVHFDASYENLEVIEALTATELTFNVDGQVTDENSGEVVEYSADIHSSIAAIVHDHTTHIATRDSIIARGKIS